VKQMLKQIGSTGSGFCLQSSSVNWNFES